MSNLKESKDLDSMGSKLCLSCGLCCQGVHLTYAFLECDELNLAKQLGLRSFRTSGMKHAFHLPCPLYQGSGCPTYHNRPRVCADYRCKLLESLLCGEIDLKESLIRVSEIKRLIDSISVELNIDPKRGFGDSIDAYLKLEKLNNLSGEIKNPKLLLNIGIIYFVFSRGKNRNRLR